MARIRRITAVLPTGASPVAVNLAAAAATTYAFLALTARVLGPEDYAPLSVLWAAVFLAVPSLWGPVEQETGRRVATRHAHGEGAAPVMRAGGRAGVLLGVPVVVAVVVAVPWSAGAFFSGEAGVAAALAVALVAFGANHLLRASLAGVGAFWAYGACISVDSASRLAAAVVLAVAGVDEPVAYAAALALAPLVPVVLLRRRGVATEAGLPDDVTSIVGSVTPLVGGQLAAQTLINGGPIAVAALAAPGEEAVAGQFLAALVIARIPLFFFQAVQGSLLPALATHRAGDDRAGFGRTLIRLLAAIGALAVVATAGAALVGPAVVRLAFGADFALGSADLAMLAAGSGLFMVATVAAHGVIALEGHRAVARGWIAGVVIALVCLAVAADLRWRVEVAMVAGTLASAAAHGAVLGGRWRRWAPDRVTDSSPR